MTPILSQWWSRAFTQTLASFSRAHLLHAGIHLGLFDLLRDPKTSNQLARDSRLAPDLLQAWLRAAEAGGHLGCGRARLG